MRRVLVVLFVLFCSFSVCIAGNKSTHASSNGCPTPPSLDAVNSKTAYAFGYYAAAMDLSGNEPPNAVENICHSSIKDEILQTMCMSGAYDAQKDKGKALYGLFFCIFPFTSNNWSFFG